MKRIAHITTLALGLTLATAAAAQAACIVEYKAKRDNPLELYFDVTQVGGSCTLADVTARLQKQLARKGLTLLKVVSVRKQ